MRDDLYHLGECLVVTRPARRAEVVRAPAAGDARRRRRLPHLFRHDQSRPLDVLAVRDDAQTSALARRRPSYRVVNLLDRRDALTADAPHGVAFTERRLGAEEAVGAQGADDDAATDDEFARAPQRARRSRHYQNAREQHRNPARQKTLREVEDEKRADVDELRYAQSRLGGEEAGRGSPSEEKPQGQVERRAPYSCSTRQERAHEPGEDDRGESHPRGRDGVRRGQRVDEETRERE